MKKKVNYTYYLNKLCGELINKFSNRTNCNAHTPYKKKVIM
ncbi:hypothetical protein B4068_2005 [Bacillus subtilis]|nr:hypothetical protein B4068_2005 [Bacillus subtilis]